MSERLTAKEVMSYEAWRIGFQDSEQAARSAYQMYQEVIKQSRENPDELAPPELLASRLISAWCNTHGKRMPWAKAIEITAIITKMPEEEKQRLLALDETMG